MNTKSKEFRLNIKLIRSICSLTHARNLGVRASKGDIIFFFDDDVILDPNYICFTIDFYKENIDREIGGVCGIDTLVKFSWLAHKRKLLFHRLFFLSRRDRKAKLLPSGCDANLDTAFPNISQSKEAIRVFRLPGGITSYSRFVFDELVFDERYSGYSQGEDIDFSHRVSKKYPLYFLPSAHLKHRQTEDHGSWYKTEDYWRTEINSQTYLFYKHLSNNPLNYFALLWSWFGLFIYHGLYKNNPVALRGITRGIKEAIINKPYKGNLFNDNG